MKKYFTLFLIFFLTLRLTSAQVSPQIRLNQTGFYPAGEKMAAVITSASAAFSIKSSADGSEVFSGTLSVPKDWDKSGEKVALADFSDLTTEGVYYLEAEGIGRSYDFFIGHRAQTGTARSALKAYYFNRASTALTEEFAGRWMREAGHPDTEVLVHSSAATEKRPAGTKISAPKGWYDAGDYNKYIVNSGISVYTLLSAYQQYPEFFNNLETNIPESGDAIPDLLDEVMWNLEWMLDMQDPNDGGVYHKLTTANFSGAVMPDQATATRYVVQKSTAAALNFAAVMAQSHRVYAEFDPEFAAIALQAAKEAYAWAVANPAVYYIQSELNKNHNPDINTGEYGDGNVSDEFNWAATELYLSTKDDTYYNQIKLNYSSGFWAPGWDSANTLALMSLLLHEEELTQAGKQISADVKAAFLKLADAFLKSKKDAPYGVSINDFYWGSNSLAGNQGMILLVAYEVSGNEEYLKAASASLDYLLGRNATTYSFVTGIGKKPPMNIHHRQSEADNLAEPVPGFLAGGPQPGQQDGCTYPSDLDAKSYSETWCSYASNEVTINWNAPLVFLAAGLESAYEQNNFTALNGTPPVPEDLSAEETPDKKAELGWKVLSSDVIRYIIERSEGDEQNFKEIAAPAGTILSFTDESTLKSGTDYFYRIKSVNTFGESAYSEVTSVTIEGTEPTGIFDKTKFTKEFKAVPNPSSGILHFSVSPEDAGTGIKVSFISIHGKVIKEYVLIPQDTRFTLEAEGLSGLYLIRMEGKKGAYAPQKILFR